MITVPDFEKKKAASEKLTMVTCYDSSFARILNDSSVDVLLVGDSSAMVMHGMDSTIHADPAMIATHVRAVRMGAPSKFIVADMPFLSVRQGLEFAVRAAGDFLRAGAHAVKIEGVRGHEQVIRHLVESGIPVMGHLGLTPQFVNAFGGMRVQAKSPEEQDVLLQDALRFQELGAFSLVLECIPAGLAARVSRSLKIPTIGIGAGVDVDGQVLVLQDLLGFQPGFNPKFLRKYLGGYELFKDAFERFAGDVRGRKYPGEKESY